MDRVYFNRKSLLFVIPFFLTAHSYLLAQQGPGNFRSNYLAHVRVGGSLGISFSGDAFSGFLAPKAVYDFNKYFSSGIGIAGSYTSLSTRTAHSLTGSLLGLIRPWPRLQFSIQYDQNMVSEKREMYGSHVKDHYWYPSFFLGLGYTTGQVTFGLRYDVLFEEKTSLYPDALMPFVSIYF